MLSKVLRHLSSVLLVSIILLSCSQQKQADVAGTKTDTSRFDMLDYLEVAKILEMQGGPYIVDLKNRNNKELVLIGCPHSRDTAAREFAIMALYFKHLNPQLAFNEGGAIATATRYTSKAESILANGETGYLKYLCDQANITMLNGDLPEAEEFAAMLKRYPKEDLLLYYTVERFVVPMYYGNADDEALEKGYPGFITYLTDNQFLLEEDEKSISYFKELYEREMNQPFSIKTIDIEKFDFLNDGCKYCAIGRASKVVRDEALLNKIDKALDKYDRIFVTFGGAHAIAIEPALKALLKNKETI